MTTCETTFTRQGGTKITPHLEGAKIADDLDSSFLSYTFSTDQGHLYTCSVLCFLLSLFVLEENCSL